MQYFTGTAQEAFDAWLRVKDDLLAGRAPRAIGEVEGLSIADLCNKFLTAKDRKLAAGEITARTRADYKATCDRIVVQFGKTPLVVNLSPKDFEVLRDSIAKTYGPVALGNEIQRIRVVFKYAADNRLIPQPVGFGSEFNRPSRKVLRLERAKKAPKLFEPAELLKLIGAADVHVKAMIMLGLNCGFGNADCGTLPLGAVDLDGGWLDYHRPKTGIDRRCPLWSETIKAVRESIAKRPEHRHADAAELVFVTRLGASWAKENTDNPITKEFRKLLDHAELHKPGLGYYTLRHVFRTIADESRDQPACDAIMGHADESMPGRYRERISDERLRAVVDHVHA